MGKLKIDKLRDPGGFVAIPLLVMDCAAYLTLSDRACALLLELARQVNTRDNNNGRLLLSRDYMKKRGWLSAGAVEKARDELIEAGFIFQTCTGARPNKASWYAVTWRALAKLPGYDDGAAALFRRGAYLQTPAKPKRPPPGCKRGKKNASLIPTAGTLKPAIVPTAGTPKLSVVPTAGTMRRYLTPAPVPTAGIHLEIPSTVPGIAYARR